MKQTLKYIYGIVYENMKFAETKHSIILTLASAVIAFATTFFGVDARQNLFAIASIILALIAILYSFVALVARRVRIKNKKLKKEISLINYKDITRFDAQNFVEQIKREYDFTKIYKPDKMDYHLAYEVIITAKLAYIKFLYFNFAVLFLIVSIVCIILSVLIRGGIW